MNAIYIKKVFDLFFAITGLIVFFPIITIAFIASSIDLKSFGIFSQVRVGKNGNLFCVYKIKTMTVTKALTSAVSATQSDRITKLGWFLRQTKIDELPQLWNILKGDMSFVGPRPDVPGYADKLDEKTKGILLSVRPGITGPATLKYRNEEDILSNQDNPEQYNDEIIYPDKVNINVDYIQNWSFKKDLYYIWKTIFQ